MKFKKEALKYHEGGKFEIKSKVSLENKDDLSLAYTPAVAYPCEEISKDKANSYKYTSRSNLIAVISNGTATLGLGDIGPEAAMPVIEGKALLFKKFANVDAIPLCIKKQSPKETVKTIKDLEPTFAGINLEDIKAPECFEIEEALKKEMNIPIFHDDQHGTAIVVLAGLINALKLTSKDKQAKIIINGAGAAGIAITKLLLDYNFTDITICDSKGIIHKERQNLNKYKEQIAKKTNKTNQTGNLKNALKNADIFIGVSKGNILTKEMIQQMDKDPIIFAMANPTPEIDPKLAKEAGAKIIATGRSDYPNQINNVLVFPGLFRGVLDSKRKQITTEMKIKVAETLAKTINNDLSYDKIIPDPFNKEVPKKIAKAICEL
jgi:malate dehydrogenase (oxaloacetate-decarboxylating)